MYHLYILKCADGSLYTGITTDLKRRVGEHNGGKLGARYTASRRPVKIVYSKKFKNRSTASRAEAEIKKLKRSDKLKLIAVASKGLTRRDSAESKLAIIKRRGGNL